MMTHSTRQPMSPERKYRLRRTIAVGSLAALTGIVGITYGEEAPQRSSEHVAISTQLIEQRRNQIAKVMGQFADPWIGFEPTVAGVCARPNRMCSLQVEGTYNTENATTFTQSVGAALLQKPFTVQPARPEAADGVLHYESSTTEQIQGQQFVWDASVRCDVDDSSIAADGQPAACDVAVAWSWRSAMPRSH